MSLGSVMIIVQDLSRFVYTFGPTCEFLRAEIAENMRAGLVLACFILIMFSFM